MPGSILTILFFAASAMFGERAATYWGSHRANGYRLVIATFLMGIPTLLLWSDTLHPSVFLWFFISGIIGFGFGDIALFLALPRIGARLTVLLNLCTAPLWSAIVEWLWLGTIIRPVEWLAAAILLSGVTLAILSRSPSRIIRSGSHKVGIVCGLLAGCGQGIGAVLSRQAETVADANNIAHHGFAAAWQRVLGGCLITTLLLAFLVLHRRRKNQAPLPLPTGRYLKPAMITLLGATICGPILGVSCFQWALAELPSGIVLAAVATTPIAMIPMAWKIDGERPAASAIIGSILAVTGVCLLFLL